MLKQIGWDTLEHQTRTLTAHLRAGLTDLRGVRVIDNLAWPQSSAITSFTVAAWETQAHQAFVESSYQAERTIIKFQPEMTAIRVSVAGFNTVDEIDHLLATLRQHLPAG